MQQYPDLIWTLLVSVGGFMLLLGHEREFNIRNWVGVGLLFVGFLVQLYWELATHPTGGNILGMNGSIVEVTIILVADILLLIWPGWVRKWMYRRGLLTSKGGQNMLVRYYDSSDGKFLNQGIIDNLLRKGEPVVLDERYVVVDTLPYQVDLKDNVVFQPILLKKQK